jgi:hypothetical protein
LGNLHIDWSESTVGDGAADGTGEGESGVESNSRELLRSGSDGSSGGHCEGYELMRREKKGVYSN